MKYVHQQGGDSQEQRHTQEQPERREGQDGGEGMVEQVKDLGEPFVHSFTSFSGGARLGAVPHFWSSLGRRCAGW